MAKNHRAKKSVIPQKKSKKKPPSLRNDILFLLFVPVILTLLITLFFTVYIPPSDGKYFQYHYQAQNQKIDYSQKYDPNDKSCNQLILKISGFNQQLITSCGIPLVDTDNSVIPNNIFSTLPTFIIEKRKEEFWNKIKTEHPEFKLPNYTRDNYGKFMAFDLPILLAPKGILVLTNINGIVNTPLNTFSNVEFLLTFYPVKSTQLKTLNIFSQFRTHNIVFVENNLTINNHKINPFSQLGNAQRQYQNIIINQTELEDLKNHPKMVINLDMYNDLPRELMLENALRQETMEQFYNACVVNLAYKCDNYCADQEKTLHDYIHHESIHAYAEEPKTIFYKPDFDRFIINNPEDLLHITDNCLVNLEIDALMGKNIYVKNIPNDLYQFFMSKIDETNSFQHNRARVYIFDKIIDYIVANPKKYKYIIPYDKRLGETRKQVAFHLANFINHPEEYHELFSTLLSLRQKEGYNEDFSRGQFNQIRLNNLLNTLFCYILPYIIFSVIYLYICHPKLFTRKIKQ